MSLNPFFSFILVLFAAIFPSVQALSDDCIRTRAAFDIGSGATKLKVAKVDRCKQRLVEVLLDDSRAVGFKDDLQKSSSGAFSDDIMAQGIMAIRGLREAASKIGATEFGAVATSAFRDAKNTAQYIERIKNETGVQIIVISQKDEAILGFVGAMATASFHPDDLVVWDIGAGSMQMLTKKALNGSEPIYEGNLASVSFKNALIEEVQKRPKGTLNTPNPISLSDKDAGLKIAEQQALEVHKEIARKIRSGAVVVGIGGVHYHSVRKSAGSAGSYTRTDLERAINEKAGFTDQQLGGKYASTEVSNLILVLGFMNGLGIETVHAVNANMADGILAHPAYWVSN